MPASRKDIREKLGEYDTVSDDRQAKQDKHAADKDAVQTAMDTEEASRKAWLDALAKENEVEDELEAMIVAHEPPAAP